MADLYQPTDISELLLQILAVIALFFILAVWSSRFRPVVKGPEIGDLTFLMWGEDDFGGLTHKWSDATSETTLSWVEDLDFGGEPERKEFQNFLGECKKLHVYGVRDSAIHRRAGVHIGKVLVISSRDLDDPDLQDIVSGRWYWLPYPHRASVRRVYAHPDSKDWGVQQIPGVGRCRVVTLTPVGRTDLREQVKIDSKVRWDLIKELVPRTTAMAESRQIMVTANARVAEAEDSKREVEEELRTVSDERDFLAKSLAKIQAEGGGGASAKIITPARTGFLSMLLLAVVGYIVGYTQIPLLARDIEPMFAGLIGLIALPLVFLWRRGLLNL